jgi:peptidoglycan/xylan/chitin deacetylase (PgdA/CDA1 family)
MGKILSIIILAITITGIGGAILFCYFIGPWLYGKWKRVSLRRLAVRSNSIVFTFDDGPSDVTPNVLAVLRQYNVKATFFLCGVRIAGRENIVRQIAAEEHEIGSHTHNHLHHWYVLPFRAIKDIKQGWQVINNALGIKNGKYPFRPPYGKLNLVSLLYLCARRVPIIYWTIDSRDISTFEKFDSQRNALLIKKEGGAVVLTHDHDPKTEERVLTSLRQSLAMAKETNMKVLTVSELLNHTR